jgi:quinol-cytochrome oxidoreductase complex cytochrome b subunit
MEMRLINIPLLSILNDHLIDYPTPININYMWGFGSIAGICLLIQIITGICLAMHYTPHVDLAFNSVEHIMRDVNNGWLLRYIHANGASMFFIAVYTHIARGLYYSSYSYPRLFLWYSGIVIFILMMATAFMGYVLPWGQMSFWGATVITNLFSAIPYVGPSITLWLWGGFSVDNATLNRFFSLHYTLPFIIAALAIVHLSLLHLEGSNNPLGVCTKIDKVNFYPYFVLKDIFGLICFLTFFAYFVFFNPNYLGHPDNYIRANSLVTPTHIVPEWYFLPFYAILRSIPDKLGGVLCMGAALVIFFVVPFIYTNDVKAPQFKPIYSFFFWFFMGNIILLGWLGGCPIEDPFTIVSQVATFFYFFYLTFILYFINQIEIALVYEIYKKHWKY